MLRAGVLVQVGTPGELYATPRNSFMADFIGPTNLLAGTIVDRANDFTRVQTGAGMILVASADASSANVVLSIRPERIRVVDPISAPSANAPSASAPSANGINRLTGVVSQSTFLGDSSEHLLQINNARIKIVRTPPLWNPPGELTVEFDANDVIALKE